jgi:type I restriction enzyme, S subunit
MDSNKGREGYKETKIGWIPVDWDVVKLEDYIHIKHGYAFQSEYFNAVNGPVLLTPGNFLRNGGLYFNKRNTKKYTGDYPLDYVLNPNDLVIVMTDLSSLCEILGNPGLIPEFGSMLHNQRIGKVLFNEKKFDKLFLFNFFLSERYKKFIKSGATGTTVRHTSPTKICSVLMQFPPLPEQKKIASILSTVDEKLEVIESQVAETEQLKKGLMQRLLTEGIGHTEFKDSEIGRIPKGWEVKRLEDMIENKSILKHIDGNHGGLYPKAKEFVASGVPYIAANCIDNNILSLQKAKYLPPERASQFKKGVAYEGDVLFAHNATVGPVALLDLPFEKVILSTTLTLYRCNLNKISNRYLLYFLQSWHWEKQYSPMMKQTTRNQIPITTQRKLFITLPPLTEQKEIASILSNVTDKISHLQAKKSATETLKKGLMQKLLTGQIRVKVPA